MDWTPEMVNRVRALVAENHSAGQIAGRLNAELGLELSRNAVIGIMHRRGITGRTVTLDEQAERAKSNGHAARKRERIRMARFIAPPADAIFSASEPPPASLAVPYARPCSLMELSDKTCRFPIGEVGADDFAFCGDQPADGAPYCAFHARLCYSPAYPTRAARR